MLWRGREYVARHHCVFGSGGRNGWRLFFIGLATLYCSMGAAADAEAQARTGIGVKLVVIAERPTDREWLKARFDDAMRRLREVGVRANLARESTFEDTLRDNALSRSVARTYAWQSYAEQIDPSLRPGVGEMTIYLLPSMQGPQPRPYQGGMARRVCSAGTRTGVAFASCVVGNVDKCRLVILHEALHLLGAYHAAMPGPSVMAGDAFSYSHDGEQAGWFSAFPITGTTKAEVNRCIRTQKQRRLLR